MKMVLGYAAIVLVYAMVVFGLTGCELDRQIARGEHSQMTYILPNGVECIGHVEMEWYDRSGFPMLICDDGMVYHNISNYRAVHQINPLYNGTK